MGCKNRTVECHGRCDLYINYKKEHQKWAHIVYQEHVKENMANDYSKKKYEKYNEAKKKGYI